MVLHFLHKINANANPTGMLVLSHQVPGIQKLESVARRHTPAVLVSM